MGQPNACQDGFKYRVVDVLATLVFNGHNTISHTSTTRSAGVLGDLETAVSRVVSVEVENDSSAAGEVVIQTKTNGSIYR
jgi:hypothetical protein